MSLNHEDLQKAREIKAFLERNYARHYSYDELACKFCLNKNKLVKAFKAVTDDNVHEYVTKVRIENAKVLLENSNRTIRDIAHKVGLDKSNFIIQFKNHTGQKPTEWRNSAGSDDDQSFKHTGT